MVSKHYILKVIAIVTALMWGRDLTATDYVHLIMYGQSLSEGYQSYPPITIDPIEGAYMLGDQVWINRNNSDELILTPLHATVSNYDVINGYKKTRANGAKCENPVIGIASYLRGVMPGYNAMIATSCGSDGKTIEQLSKEQSGASYLYGDYTKTLDRAKEYAATGEHTITCPAVFWMQGEYNYKARSGADLTSKGTSTTDKDAYKALLVTLKNNMQADVAEAYGQERPLFITYQTAGQKWCTSFECGISMAQLEASNEYADIVCAGPVYPVTDRGGHLDPNGYRWYGEMLGKVYYKTVVLGEDFKPLQPTQITKVDDKTLNIKFLVPVAPLVLDVQLQKAVKDYGFIVKASGKRLTINSVSISEGENVVIRVAEPLDGDVEIGYAGSDNSGHGNLRDSDPTVGYSTYEDLDRLNADGSYYYERDATETTLRPDYEPIVKRQYLHGQPYPLYNYSVMFYYKIPATESMINVAGFENEASVDAVFYEDVKSFKVIDNHNGTITIKGCNDRVEVEIYDMSGRKYLEAKGNNVDVERLIQGIYVVKVTNGQLTKSIKYLKSY